LAGVWGNSDLEFSQKVNAQNGTGHSGLQEIGNKKFALELDSFLNETPRGDWLLICSLRRGPDGLVFLKQGTVLSVAPVSTKYLSFVNFSVKKLKKMRPASAGKCVAVAVACV
jgi:hypothetical protein